jgi:SAM-dependent methyltransferase
MDEYKKANLALWNEWAQLHAGSKFYDVAGFKTGKTSLNPLEMEELGNVAGKTLLHLQCHFGLDSLSWARLGARVTGADFSEQAIALARSLSQEVGVKAEFVCSDIDKLPQVLSGQFDIVYTSYGVLAWLPDLQNWAAVIAHFLKPGGFFHIAESHPFLQVFPNEKTTTDLQVQLSYFPSPEPTRWEPEGCYADKDAQVTHPSYEWTHSLAEIINALIGAGLRIDFLHEFPFLCWDNFPFMQKGSDGLWRLPGDHDTIPLTFSLKATKPL